MYFLRAKHTVIYFCKTVNFFHVLRVAVLTKNLVEKYNIWRDEFRPTLNTQTIRKNSGQSVCAKPISLVTNTLLYDDQKMKTILETATTRQFTANATHRRKTTRRSARFKHFPGQSNRGAQTRLINTV